MAMRSFTQNVVGEDCNESIRAYSDLAVSPWPAYFAAAAPAAAQSTRSSAYCFSTNSDNYKQEDFYARGLAACNREINSGKHKGKNLAFFLRAKGYWLRVMKQARRGAPDL